MSTCSRRMGRLATDSPFHLEATVRVLQRRPANRVDVWDRERYLRVLPTVDGLAFVETRNYGTVDDPDLRYSFPSGTLSRRSHRAAGVTLRRILGLDVDALRPLKVAEIDPSLAPVALALRGVRPPRFAALFEAFANVIPFQQVSLDAGVAIVGRVIERFGEWVEHDGNRFYAFPTARAVCEAGLDTVRACGLSLHKAETLQRVARAIESGELTEEKLSQLDSGDAVRFLTEIRGIGPWSAGLVLLRGLGRLDVFPLGDVGAARGLRRLMQLPAGPRLDRVIQDAGEYRGCLYFLALGSALLARGLIHPAPARRRSKARLPTPPPGPEHCNG
jgi:3-methyladenine DNA glycosylase/8-oxoguanine DNA glycosylase